MNLEITRRKSRQRELIKSVLFSSYLSHPTAEEVCVEVKKIDSSISLGTIYRNLNLLTDNGEIKKISGVDSSDRFDFQIHPHAHFNCSRCGKLFDVSAIRKSFKNLESEGFIVESVETIFKGICPHCSKKFHLKNQKKGKK